MDKIINKIREQNTAMIKQCIEMMGGDYLPTEQTMVRAALIEVYMERVGDDAGVELMYAIGLAD